MKKVICLFISMFVTIYAFSQRTITMEKEGGVYKIPCTVNGARMKMIFDTGASSISISMSIANFLYENDYIVKSDILGKGQSLTASGDIVDHIVINLRDVEVGGVHLKNVEATVIDGQDAPLLLGQTAIQALGSITISGDKLIINDAPKQDLTYYEGNVLREDANNAIKNESFFAAKDCLEKLSNSHLMTLEDRDLLSFCYFKMYMYEDCINSCNILLGMQNINSDENYSLITNACYMLGESYFAIGKFDQALLWYEKHGNRIPKGSRDIDFRKLLLNEAECYGRNGNKEKCKSWFNIIMMDDLRKGNIKYSAKEPTSVTSKKFKGKDNLKNISEDCTRYALMCAIKVLDENPSPYLDIALRAICDYLGYDYNKVLNGKVRGIDFELGRQLYLRGMYAENATEAEDYIRLAKDWGDRDAQDFINGYEEYRKQQQ